MSIQIRIHRNLRHLTNGKSIVNVKGNTVGECLYDLVKQFPGIHSELFDGKGNLLNHVEIYVNSESSYPEELAKPVNEGDELSVIIMIAGG
ncbi:MAG TPA: MoaD/ThiS family protein [Desulfatiglandales bacterium]|nr:MoaD/ThiS family protein [Desulfatiglandales bacterium]